MNRRWAVFHVTTDKARITMTLLGHVDAPHQPAALTAAWETWPEFKDGTQVQYGFTVKLADREPDPSTLT